MPVGAPKTWANGDIVGATVLNEELRNQVNSLSGSPRAKICRMADGEFQTVDSTLTFSLFDQSAIRFDTTIYDYSYDGSTMVDGSELVCRVPGLYTVSAAVSWGVTNQFSGANGDQGSRCVGVGVNAGGWLDGTDASRAKIVAMVENNRSFSTDPQVTVAVSCSVKLSIGDSLGVFGGQTSGGNVALVSGPNRVFLQAQWEAVL